MSKRWAFDYHLVFKVDYDFGFFFPCDVDGKINKSQLSPEALENLELAIRYKALGCEVHIQRTSYLNDELVGERPWKTVQSKKPGYKYVSMQEVGGAA